MMDITRFKVLATAITLGALVSGGIAEAQPSPYYDHHHRRYDSCRRAKHHAGNQGVVAGAVTGGVAGGVIGHGLVGGLVGAGVGALAGHAIARSTVHC